MEYTGYIKTTLVVSFRNEKDAKDFGKQHEGFWVGKCGCTERACNNWIAECDFENQLDAEVFASAYNINTD